MRNPAGRHILDYWIQLSGDQAAPQRTTLDPIALRRFLPQLFIVATREDDWLAFRLAGSQLCDLFGREFRGQPFEAMWLGQESTRAGQILLNVMRYERPALMTVSVVAGDDAFPYEMMILPLRSGHESDRVLGALLPQTRPVAPTAVPVSGLVLDNWTFLDKGGHCPPLDALESRQSGGSARRLWGLLPDALLPTNRTP